MDASTRPYPSTTRTEPPSSLDAKAARLSTIIPAVVGLVIGAVFFTVFLAAFHTPEPHGLPVGVVAGSQAVSGLRDGLAEHDPDSLDLIEFESATQARAAIAQRHVLGAYLVFPESGRAILLYAGANGPAVTATLTGIFGEAASHTGLALDEEDVLPTSSGDTRSLSIFYTGFGLVLSGFLFGLVSYEMAPRLAFRLRGLSLAVFALFSGGAATLIAGPTGFNALPGSFLGLAAISVLIAAAVGATTLLIMRLAGPVGTMAAAIVLLIFGNATGGGTLPVYYLPELLRPLSGILPVGVGIRALQGVSYFHGDGVASGIIILAAWTGGSLALFALVGGLLRRSDKRANTNTTAIEGITHAS